MSHQNSLLLSISGFNQSHLQEDCPHQSDEVNTNFTVLNLGFSRE